MESLLNQTTQKEMRSAAGWMRFYCIVLFLATAFLFWLGLKLFGMNSIFMDTGAIAFMLIFLGITLSLMGFFLWSYTTKLIEASHTKNMSIMEEGLNKAKTFYIMWGILSIIGVLITVYELITGTSAF